ncbi:MAG TPA: DUF1572 domain-containing protein [Flavobacteriales bacterium]|nr:DUF1572 domain-containing protein [Flavobacteriales bacterium]
MDESREIHAALIREIRRRLIGESVPRLHRCLSELTEEEIWARANNNSNSVGNLILHLTGNVNQWIVSALGGEEDKRERQREFDERGPIATSVLLENLNAVMKKADAVISSLEPEELTLTKNVQGYTETVLAILIHVTEHFSYHTGQVSYIAKAQKNLDLNYYKDQDLNQTE